MNFNQIYILDDTSIILNLLNVLENLFFSMKIPMEIISKYNILKESAFSQLNIPFMPIDSVKFSAQSSLPTSASYNARQPYHPVSEADPDVYLPIVK